MGTGYVYGFPIVVHELSKKLRPGEHGYASALGLSELLVVRTYGSGIYDHIGILYVGSHLAYADPGSQLSQMLCKAGLSYV